MQFAAIKRGIQKSTVGGDSQSVNLQGFSLTAQVQVNSDRANARCTVTPKPLMDWCQHAATAHSFALGHNGPQVIISTHLQHVYTAVRRLSLALEY